MTVIEHRDDDARYEAWLQAHPAGWVANTTRRPNASYLKVHRASCPKARDLSRATGAQPLTGGRYAKTTAATLGELGAWAATRWTDDVLAQAPGKCCCAGVAVPSVVRGPPDYEDFGPGPADDPDEVQAFARRVRLGQPKFRKLLLKVYGSACAVTGTAAEAVLEAAHIEPHAVRGRNAADNGLLLRADIHVLFDLGLVRIHPDSLRVAVDEALRADPGYAALDGAELRARLDGRRPSKSALSARWTRRA